jgi:hypothetical protein
VWTALSAVPGVLQAEVSMRGVVLEADGPIERDVLADCLAMAGVRLVDMTVEKGHLPLL